MVAVGVFKLKFLIAPFTLGQQHSAMQILTFLACDTHDFFGRFHFLTLTPYCHWHAVLLSRIPFFDDDLDANQVTFVNGAKNTNTFYANRRPPSFLYAFTTSRLKGFRIKLLRKGFTPEQKIFMRCRCFNREYGWSFYFAIKLFSPSPQKQPSPLQNQNQD